MCSKCSNGNPRRLQRCRKLLTVGVESPESYLCSSGIAVGNCLVIGFWSRASGLWRIKSLGEDYADAVASAVDWLYETIINCLIKGIVPEGGKLGNELKQGGRVVAVSADCDLSKVSVVTAADAASILHVSPARVAQMCESGRLDSWKQGGHRMVTRDSIEARLAENPGPGRPRKARVE